MGRLSTDFLAPASGFLIGVATLGNLAGGYFRYNCSDSDVQADTRAIYNDFAMVGQDIQDSIDKIAPNELQQMEFPLKG